MNRQEVRERFNELMLGEYDFQAIYNFAKKLMDNGPLPEEIKGFIDSTADRAVRLNPKLTKHAKTIDVSSSGGDKLKTINVGSIVSLVLAAGGLVVGKNAARAVTGFSGSSDFFDDVGILVNYSGESVKRIEELLEKTKFATYYYPAFDLEKYGSNSGRFLRELRESGKSFVTPWNVAAWLFNPLMPKYRVYGMFTDEHFKVAAEVLQDQGVEKGWIVYGVDGLDEISNVGTTKVFEFTSEGKKEFPLEPEDFGVKKAKLEEIVVSSKEEAIQIGRKVILGKQKDVFQDLVTINAAAGFYIAGVVNDLKEGTKLAQDLLESGKVEEKVNQIKEALSIIGG